MAWEIKAPPPIFRYAGNKGWTQPIIYTVFPPRVA